MILFAFILGGGQALASSSKEERAFASAKSVFQAKLWDRAEMEFARFRENFPESTNVPMTVLLEAQSQFEQKKFDDAIRLLKENESGSGAAEDQYIYWIGESEYARSNFLDAAETFASLAQNFPDSPFALRGIVEAASAAAQLKEWTVVESLLEQSNGVFQSAAQSDSASETVARGQLLLARAKSGQGNFSGATAVLNAINPKALIPPLDWQQADLRCGNEMAAGHFQSALAAVTNLFQIATKQQNSDLLAESHATLANILEKMNLRDDAIAAYRKNLNPDAPVEWQRQAILKIAEIAGAQNQLAVAGQSLADFLQQFSNAPAADVALLTLGELHLKIYVADRSATNELQQAAARFNQFIGTFTNSPLLGKAFLDRGWCEWFADDTTNSLSDFESAARILPESEDLAVAKFKLGDALFAERNFKGARTNYDAVVNEFADWTNIMQSFGGRALYQSLRASLELKDFNGATNAMTRMMTSKQFRFGELTPNAELLYGEGLGDWGKPATARETFQYLGKYLGQLWPNSDLQPQIEFAIAHTYELEKNWPMAIEQYQNWLAEFPTNELATRVNYALAWANYQNGNDTNAAALFQNFIARFHTNDYLAPRAQFWLGDYFYGKREFVGAETNYEHVYQDWPSSALAFPAHFMAGRAAVGHGSYNDAKNYFADTFNNTNCPPDIAAQAMFGYGTTLMTADSGTTNLVANFFAATNLFSRIVLMYPTNDYGALAWCYIGECDVQISDYDSATNAYAQVFNSTNFNISMRSRAKVGFGIALEKKADQAADADKKILLQQARDSYLDVFYQNDLRDNELADPFWTAKAGLQALPLVQKLGVGDPDKFIDQMEMMLPQLKDSLEKKRAELSRPKS